MRKLLLLATALFCALSAANAVPVTPATIPHVTFVGAAGLPCAGCSLFSYAAGTTTPLATYIDANGTSVNPNPIILDAAGGANIWLGRNSYKFILKDTLGNTIWTVDQVNAANLFPCSPANSIQIANSGVNGLNCDPNITIDTINHTLSVGTLGANYVTIGALGTPTSWFFDTTTPATACASIGCVGGITSLGLTVPAWLTVTGSPVTSSGTLAVTATTGQTANEFLATPNGSTGALGLRTIVPADLPLASTTAFGAAKCDGTTISCTSGVIAAIGAGATTVCSGTSIPWGCYRISGDGTIEQWGVSIPASTGGDSSTIGINFPHAFTTTDNLLVTATPDACPNGTCGGNYVLSVNLVPGTLSTLSVDAFLGSGTPVGGGGSVISGTVHVNWHAFGK